MKKSTLYIVWAGLFTICAGLGFVPNPEGSLRILLTLFSLAFFVPPAVLLYRAKQKKDINTLRLIRNLSALSLALTAVLLVVNVASAFRSAVWGNIVHTVLVIVSSPMICSGDWAAILFLWACLLMVSLKLLKKK